MASSSVGGWFAMIDETRSVERYGIFRAFAFRNFKYSCCSSRGCDPTYGGFIVLIVGGIVIVLDIHHA